MKRLALLLCLAALPATAQQDCAVGAHQFKDGACIMTFVNGCGRPLHCTLVVEGVTARGDRLSDSRVVVVPSGSSQSMSIGGVARCGSFDAQCINAGQQRRR